MFRESSRGRISCSAPSILVILLACLIGGAGVAGLLTVQSRMHQVTNESTPSLVQLLHVHDDINFGMRGSRGEILATTAAKIADVSGDVETARAGAWQAFQAYLRLPGKSTHEAAVAASSGTNLQDWLSTTEQVKQLAAVNTPAGKAAATKLSLGANADAIDRMDPDLQALLAINQSAVDAGRARADAAVTSAIIIVAAALIFAVIFALVVVLFLARSIVKPLAEVQEGSCRRISRWPREPDRRHDRPGSWRPDGARRGRRGPADILQPR